MIDIQTNNVTIDMNGWKLGGLGAGPTTEATGIYAQSRKNITIKNGIIRGFKYGILLEDFAPYENGGHIIEDLTVDSPRLAGIFLKGVLLADGTGAWVSEAS